MKVETHMTNKVTHITMNVKFPTTLTNGKITLMEQLCDNCVAVTNLIMEANMTTGFLLGGYEFNSNHDGIRATYNELDNRIKNRGDLPSRCIVLNKKQRLKFYNDLYKLLKPVYDDISKKMPAVSHLLPIEQFTLCERNILTIRPIMKNIMKLKDVR